MRPAEKLVYGKVKSELRPLSEIQNELGVTYQEVYGIAMDLVKEGLIRDKVIGIETYVCRVIEKDKKSLIEKYWWVIGLLAYFGGVYSPILTDMARKYTLPQSIQEQIEPTKQDSARYRPRTF
ncbi:MAG: hypothetical protein IT233_11245 [Bacteroidia bacterium]|nr:hypothetical protein [Bacteroidia bacterium]